MSYSSAHWETAAAAPPERTAGTCRTPRGTYQSPRGAFQQIDGKMDVEVEFQLPGEGIAVSEGAGKVLLPQAEERLLVPAVKGGEEVLLRRARQTGVTGCPFPRHAQFSQPSRHCGDPIAPGFRSEENSLLFERKGQKTGDPGSFKLRRPRLLQTDPAFPPLCRLEPGLYKKLTRPPGPLKQSSSATARGSQTEHSQAHEPVQPPSSLADPRPAAGNTRQWSHQAATQQTCCLGSLLTVQC